MLRQGSTRRGHSSLVPLMRKPVRSRLPAHVGSQSGVRLSRVAQDAECSKALMKGFWMGTVLHDNLFRSSWVVRFELCRHGIELPLELLLH